MLSYSSNLVILAKTRIIELFVERPSFSLGYIINYVSILAALPALIPLRIYPYPEARREWIAEFMAERTSPVGLIASDICIKPRDVFLKGRQAIFVIINRGLPGDDPSRSFGLPDPGAACRQEQSRRRNIFLRLRAIAGNCLHSAQPGWVSSPSICLHWDLQR